MKHKQPQFMLVVATSALLLSACGSAASGSFAAPPQTTQSAAVPVTASAAAPPPAPSTPPPSSAAPTGDAVTGSLTDSQGDAVTLSLSVGTPQIVANVSDPDAQDCNDDLSDAGTSAAQSVAYPIEINMTVTSDEPATIGLNMAGFSEMSGGSAQSANTIVPMYAGNFTGSQMCNVDLADPLGAFYWTNVAPNQPITWSGYMIFQGVVTPDDPTGVNQSTGLYVLSPSATIDGNTTNYTIDTADSQNLVDCGGTGAGYQYVALVPSLALSSGCTQD